MFHFTHPHSYIPSLLLGVSSPISIKQHRQKKSGRDHSISQQSLIPVGKTIVDGSLELDCILSMSLAIGSKQQLLVPSSKLDTGYVATGVSLNTRSEEELDSRAEERVVFI